MASGRTLQSTIEISGVLSPSLQAAIKSAVDKLEEMSEETLASAGAAEKLTAEIGAQESVLKNLQRGYADFIVSGQEGSDEAQTLADRIQELSGELEDNRDTLRAAEKAAQNLAAAQGDAADAYTQLEKKISSQQDELTGLRRQYANVVLEQGETSDEARQLANRISDLSGELNQNEQSLREAQRAADSLGDSMEDAGESVERSSEGYTILKNVIANLATEAINKAVDAFKELATEGDTALGMLEAKTGATASEIEGFEDVMYEVYNANYGESLGDVSDRLATVIQMTDDLDNASLAKVTKSAIALEDVFGFETVESLRAANSLMDQFGLTSDQAFNLIVQGAQNGLNQNDDLLDTINEYSVQFKNAGYSADDMFNMLANGADSGTWSVDKLGDAVKEFNIRASDGTIAEAIQENAKAFGMTKKEASALGAEIEGGSVEAYQKLLDKLKEVDDDAQRYQLGVAMFGTMWEDLGEETVMSLMETQGAISSTADAMDQMDGAAYDTLESSLSQLGRTIKSEVVEPVAKKLTPALKNAVNFINSKVGPAVDWVLAHLPEIGVALGALSAVIVAMKWGSLVSTLGKVGGAFTGIKTALAAVSGPALAIIAVVAALAAGFVYLWKTNEDFRNNMTEIWEQLQSSFSELGGTISGIIDQLMPLIAEIAGTVLSAFGEIAAAVIPILMQIIADILPVIIDLINQLLPVLTVVIETVLTTLIDVINQLLPLFMQIVQAILPVIVQLVQTLLPIIMQIVQAVLPVLIQLINTILPILTQIIDAVLPILVQILNMLTPILTMIVSLLQPILNLIISLVTPILNLIMTAITPLIEIFSTLITSILQPIMPILTAVAEVITSVLGSAIEGIKPIVEALTSVFQGLIDFITGVFSGNWSQAWSGVVQVFGGLWDGLVGIVKAPINAVIGLINKAIGALNGISVTIPDWVPLVGGNTFGINIPTIPMLATGGFTDGVSIAGEAGTEAVISFDPAYRAQNVGVWERAGQMLGVLDKEQSEAGAGLTSKAGELLTLDDFSLGSLADGTSVVIYYDFSGFTWSPQIQTSGNNESKDDLMAKLKAHEAEFFDWLEEFIQAREVAQYA